MEHKNMIGEWISSGFLKALPSEKRLVLQTPLVIKFSDKVSNQILSRYDPLREVGGVLLAVPTSENEDKTLFVNRIVFLENLSPKPGTSYYRSNIRNDIRKVWEDCSKEDKQPYIPMFFIRIQQLS